MKRLLAGRSLSYSFDSSLLSLFLSGEARADVESLHFGGVDSITYRQLGDAPRDGDNMIDVRIQGRDELTPPCHEPRRLVGCEDRRRRGRVVRNESGRQCSRFQSVAAIGFQQRVHAASQKDEEKPVKEAIHYGLRRDAQLSQEIFITIEPLITARTGLRDQTVDAFAAIVEIVTGGLILKPQIHLRADRKIIVHAEEDLCRRRVLAGHTQEGHGNAFEIVEVNHVKRAVLAQERGEHRLHFGRRCSILSECFATGGNERRVDDHELADALFACLHFAEERPARKGTVAVARAEEPCFIAPLPGGVDQVLLVDGHPAATLPWVLEISPIVVEYLELVHDLLCLSRYPLSAIRDPSADFAVRLLSWADSG